MQIQSSWRENLIKANQNLEIYFFFSSNRRYAVLKLCKSWYETRYFADRAVIAAILNSLDILLFRSVIRYTADNR